MLLICLWQRPNYIIRWYLKVLYQLRNMVASEMFYLRVICYYLGRARYKVDQVTMNREMLEMTIYHNRQLYCQYHEGNPCSSYPCMRNIIYCWSRYILVDVKLIKNWSTWFIFPKNNQSNLNSPLNWKTFP